VLFNAAKKTQHPPLRFPAFRFAAICLHLEPKQTATKRSTNEAAAAAFCCDFIFQKRSIKQRSIKRSISGWFSTQQKT